MKKLDLSRLNMWRAVREVLESYRTIWTNNLEFANLHALLTEMIFAVTAALQSQSSYSKGVTADRAALAREAVDLVLDIGKIAKVHAMKTINEDLRAAVSYSPSVLLRLAPDKLIARLRNIIDASEAYHAALLSYGLAPSAFEAAREAVKRVEERLPDTRAAIVDRKAVTSAIPATISKGQTTIEMMDNLIHLFEASAPEFVAAYKAARSVVHGKSRHTDTNAA